MAEEENKSAEEVEAPAADAGGGSEPSKVGKMLVILSLVVWLIGFSGSAALIYFSTYGFIAPTVTEEDVYDAFVAKRETSAEEPAIYTLDSFSVNLSGRPRRSIRIQVSLHMLSEDGFEEIGELDAEARDSIVRLLGSKNFSDLETIQGKLFLKQQIATNLNKRLKDGVIKDVYFNDFIIR